jgi:hypothetical protein
VIGALLRQIPEWELAAETCETRSPRIAGGAVRNLRDASLDQSTLPQDVSNGGNSAQVASLRHR